ncbi:putative F-box protein At1g67623 [Cucurbita pepo subsp. pepo]|uniref:putative F-box protein At1g67623 n=1 Tax=Cucurbita pepo subsp. pepo TaxID=3664 RepID=UPI000C9D56D5|nr:putative F-box protein At1g67623 [Cucurbita pepo subsp. pepo]XP_023549481.1 putative F-box protein At1g67623 [Cucurbita pepo subsp. pepo]
MAGSLKRKSQALDSQISRTTKMARFNDFPPTIESLPNDLLIEVLAKVAAFSFTDLVQAKLATKEFLKASSHGYIFQHASLRNFQKLIWNNNPEFWSFMEKCNNNGNPETLYQKGMLEFFTHCREASGLAYLKLSAQKGYPETCYVYGIILYAASLEDEGVKFLKICEAKLGFKLAECRRRVKEFVRYLWVKNKISLPEKDSSDQRGCESVVKNCCKKNVRRIGWDGNDEDDYYREHTCEACKWNEEVSRFCNMLRTGSYDML